MYINQITYVTAISLRELQSKVEEEMLTRAQVGHVFFTALPLVPKQSMNTLWVQPLVFVYDTEGGDPAGNEYKVGASNEVITAPSFERLDADLILVDGKHYSALTDEQTAEVIWGSANEL